MGLSVVSSEIARQSCLALTYDTVRHLGCARPLNTFESIGGSRRSGWTKQHPAVIGLVSQGHASAIPGRICASELCQASCLTVLDTFARFRHTLRRHCRHSHLSKSEASARLFVAMKSSMAQSLQRCFLRAPTSAGCSSHTQTAAQHRVSKAAPSQPRRHTCCRAAELDVSQREGQTAESTEASALPTGELDLRVGQIVSCEKHPDADSLYVEKINVGEEETRTIVSGLVEYVAQEDLMDRKVCTHRARASICGLIRSAKHAVPSAACVEYVCRLMRQCEEQLADVPKRHQVCQNASQAARCCWVRL